MTPKTTKRAVNRRDSQNKSSGSVVDTRVAKTVVWNQLAQPMPNVSRTQGNDNHIYNIWQVVDLGNQSTSSSGGEVDGQLQFALSQVGNASSLAGVFDQYRIKQVEAWITLQSSTTLNPVDNFRWATVIDYDDNSAKSIATMLQYTNVTDCGRPECVYRRFVPHIRSSIDAGGSATLAGNVPSASEMGWCDMANNNVTHYGIKWGLSATSTTVVLSVRARFHIQLRNTI